MKICCTKMKTGQKVSTKTKTGKKLSAFLPMIITFFSYPTLVAWTDPFYIVRRVR
jgi:hypothetical protein